MMHVLEVCVLYLTVFFPYIHAKRIPRISIGTRRNSGTVSYRELAHATAKYSSVRQKSVDVFFGRKDRVNVAHLTRDGIDESAFQDVTWHDSDSSGFDDVDKYYIDKYTGRFDYSRNVGVVLRGITPYTEQEDPANKHEEKKDHAKLTLEVLKWAVGFGAAINKLPDLPEPRTLWRGAWETSGHVRHMQSLPGTYSVPWFQPMSSNQSYAPTFLQEKYQPNVCEKTGCIKTGHSFPVMYEFNTLMAKDLTQWNPEESEFMLLPNTAFRILSVEKIINDKFLEMDTHALEGWLRRGDHRPVDPNDDRHLGPFTELADAVSKVGWDGPRFVKEYDSGYLVGPKGRYDYHLRYLVNLGIDDGAYSYDLQTQLTLALRNRYKLPPVKGVRYATFVGNSVPFYFRIVGESV